jgi:ribonuclease E
MTFYEAALRILEEAGAPMNYLEITKRSLDKGLLSHVGKVPEQTMLARLAAQAKRSRDRKLVVTARDTFALSDWMLQEDADALAVTGTIEPNAEEALPPLRPTERHPEPRAEYLRAIGRQAERNRRRDDDGKRKKFPPVPEVAFEVLSEVSGLVPSELIARLKARELTEELGTLTLLEALAADNQERVDQGRRPQFTAIRSETNELQLSVETSVPENGPPPVQTQEAFCKAANLPFENGRVVLRSQRRKSEPAVVAVASSPEDLALIQTARLSVKDARRAMARLLRKKLSELDTGTFEKACVKLLHANGFRELKVARRGKDGALLSARKKEGSLELRFAIRIARGSTQVERRAVQDLRRDVAQTSANLGLLLTPGEARNDSRSEATSGGALVMLWCGDQLSERFFDAEVGVSVMRVELFEIDEAFFEQAKVDADEAQKRRDERHRDNEGRRDDSDARGQIEPAAPVATPPHVDGVVEAASPQADGLVQLAPEGEDEGDDDEEEGDEVETAGEPGATAEGARRRKRRRRRRRRGGRPEGAPGQAIEGAPQQTAPGSTVGSDSLIPADLVVPAALEVEAAPPAFPLPTPPAPPSSGEPT